MSPEGFKSGRIGISRVSDPCQLQIILEHHENTMNTDSKVNFTRVYVNCLKTQNGIIFPAIWRYGLVYYIFQPS